MSARTVGRVAQGLAALFTTLVILVGVPAALTTWVGWPLPTSLPGLDSLDRATRTGISDPFVVNALAVIAWLAWAQVALALFTEVAAVIRGRPTARLPVAPGFQPLAARLVAAIIVLGSPFQPARVAMAAPPPIVVTATPAAVVISTESAPSPTAPPANDHQGAHIGQPVVTVQRHDSYWGIAERTLNGDGLRWREIRDLNLGRTMPDGSVITADDDIIHAGWVLLLPADGTVATADRVPVPSPGQGDATGASTVTVEQGDNLWRLAEEQLTNGLGRPPTDAEVVPYWRDMIHANEDRFVQPGNPDLIYAGQQLLAPPTGNGAAPLVEPVHDPVPPPSEPPPEAGAEPAVDGPATSVPSSVDPVADPPAGDTPMTPSQEPQEEPAENESNGLIPFAVALGGGLSSVAIAVGLKRLIARRRQQFALTHDGQAPGPTPPDQRELHQAVVAQADEDLIEDLQGVLGWLAASLAHAGSARRPRMVRHAPDSLEVLLDQPDTGAPPGWRSTNDGTVWTLEELPDLKGDPIDGPMCPAPLMVTIGQPDDDAQLYLDLEVDGLVALSGDVDVATNLARSIVTELALAPLADNLRVIVLGDLVDAEAARLDHLTVVGCWDDVAADIESWATDSHGALVEEGWPNAFIGRGHAPDHDALVPVVIVATKPPPPELARLLRELQPSAVAVVVADEFEGAVAQVRCEADTLNFDVVGLACTPQSLEADELAQMSQLLVAADSPDERQLMLDLQDRASEVAGTDTGPADAAEGFDALPEDGEPPGYDILVRFLGDIRVDGGHPLNPKPTAVVAYLALHRSVTPDRLEEACWFGSEGTSHRKRLLDVMTESREALGSQHFPANRRGTYTAGPRVRTDTELFEWYVRRAAAEEPIEALASYRSALDLVTGKPFSYPNAARASYGWVDYEHHSTTWEHRISVIAQACAELHIDLADPACAIDLLRRIIQAVPLSCPVVETLMRAHAANGDRTAAEQIYQEYRKALSHAQLGDPEASTEQLRLDLHTV